MAHNLEITSLQIKTDSTVGSEESVRLYFYTAAGVFVGSISLFFSSPPRYYIGFCSTSWTDLSATLPSDVEKVWEITKLSGPRITVSCNGVKVVDILLSDETCRVSYWRTLWSRDVEKILFSSSDTASDFYKTGSGNCLIKNSCYLRYGVAV